MRAVFIFAVGAFLATTAMSLAMPDPLAPTTDAFSGEYCISLTKQDCELGGGCRWAAASRRCESTTSVAAALKAREKTRDEKKAPAVPLPWTTTQQRTHTFTNAEFLSIAEEQSQRMTKDGFVQQAFYIYPATPFSMRNPPADTIVKGMRGIFTVNPAVPGWIHRVIFLTSLSGREYCMANAVQNRTESEHDVYQGKAQIRGNEPYWGQNVSRFLTTYDGMGTVQTDFIKEARGGPYAGGNGTEVQYPLRITRDYNVTKGEKGYMLDLGQHFPVAIDHWFNLTLASTCNKATYLPKNTLVQGPAGVESDHHTFLKTRRLA